MQQPVQNVVVVRSSAARLPVGQQPSQRILMSREPSWLISPSSSYRNYCTAATRAPASLVAPPGAAPPAATRAPASLVAPPGAAPPGPAGPPVAAVLPLSARVHAVQPASRGVPLAAYPASSRSVIVHTSSQAQVAKTQSSSSIVAGGARPVTVQGPAYTQGQYEAGGRHSSGHKQDEHLMSLKELRRICGLKVVPVAEGLDIFKTGAEGGQLTREKFLESYEAVLQVHSEEFPPESVRNEVWNLFDRDHNGVVDMMELICGISLLCAGTEDEKIHAVFQIFDENSDGFISMDEMFKFLTSVFKVVLTPNILGVMNSMGVSVESAEDLASVTALECFKGADLNHDGKLSVTEFKNWFYTPRNDPTALFTPVRRFLH